MSIQEKYVQLNGLSIRYLQCGDEGLPLVLLHGTGESALDWRWVLPQLGEKYRVYAPDLPGSGGSTKPLTGFSVASFTKVATDFLKALSLQQTVLVGNSLGGLIALQVALSQPEQIAGLVLVDSTGMGEAVSPALSLLTLPIYGELLFLGFHNPLGAFLEARSRALLQFAHPEKIPAEWYTEQERLAQTPGFLEATLALLRAQLHPLGQRIVMVDSLPQLQMPTLVMWGEQDKIFPKTQALASVERLKQGYLSIIPDCGHIPQLDQPTQFITALYQFDMKLNVLRGVGTSSPQGGQRPLDPLYSV